MDKHLQHERHESKRAAVELVLHSRKTGKPVMDKKTGDYKRVRPYGEMAYASLWDDVGRRVVVETHDAAVYKLADPGPKRQPPKFVIERRLSHRVPDDSGALHSWVKSDMRCKTIELARNFCRANRALYRLMVQDRYGVYRQDDLR
jgi:hypothetical protein